jgi:hypothetical protein
MVGILPREVSIEEDEDGNVTAVVELVRMSDLGVVGRASAMVGVDENEWQKRPRFMRRSMAVTRATGKAFRLSLAWVVRLAGYEATSAEEMDGVANTTVVTTTTATTPPAPPSTPRPAVEPAPSKPGVTIDTSREGVREVDTSAPCTEDQQSRIKKLVKELGISRPEAKQMLVKVGAQKLADLSIVVADGLIAELQNRQIETEAPF